MFVVYYVQTCVYRGLGIETSTRTRQQASHSKPTRHRSVGGTTRQLMHVTTADATC